MITELELGHRIRDLRKKTGLSQLDFGTDIGTTQATVAWWESGRGYPKLESIGKMAEAFGVPVSTLLLEGGTPKGIPTEREIGKRISAWRKLRGMPLQQLADKAGIGTTTIHNLENGLWYAKMPTYLYIAEALDVSLDALIYGEMRT